MGDESREQRLDLLKRLTKRRDNYSHKQSDFARLHQLFKVQTHWSETDGGSLGLESGYGCGATLAAEGACWRRCSRWQGLPRRLNRRLSREVIDPFRLERALDLPSVRIQGRLRVRPAPEVYVTVGPEVPMKSRYCRARLLHLAGGNFRARQYA